MGLNIKNERVHAMARRAAEVTGLSQTGAIEAALEKLLAEYGSDPVAAESSARFDLVQRISVAYRTDPGFVNVEIEAVGDLYDEMGLPA